MTEIALQGDSKGILYEGYKKAFRQCIFEEGEVMGKNERYEFRCDYDLECCGRVCCIPEAVTIPFWLMIILIILALLLLLAILGTIAYLCAKRRKPKPKKEVSSHYSPLKSTKDDRDYLVTDMERYSNPDNYNTSSYRSGHGRGWGNGSDFDRDRYRDGLNGHGAGLNVARYNYGIDPYANDYGRRRHSIDSEKHSVHETVEEHFKQEITYEKPASIDSREML